ncbi:hypothetical protein ACFFLE_03895 [Salinicoccus siamensis]|uniref:TIR domain-containing protein n=2 Tax=Salinicoccus siamensis TaxID=381830 RepID=A0ABV5Z2D3_9STAP
MEILAAGGIYTKEDSTFTGGHVISICLGSHSAHHVRLHTNLSSDSTKTPPLLKHLRQNGVDPRLAARVSAPYGTITGDGVTPSSNVFETVRRERMQKQMNHDCVILSTDISERDFRWLTAEANNRNIPVLVFTCGEYPVRTGGGIEIIHLDDSGIPDYAHHLEEIKAVLINRGWIYDHPVTRSRREQVPHPSTAILRTIGQLLLFGMLTGAVLLGILYLLGLPGEDGGHQAEIAPKQPVDHPDCSTVAACTTLGDQYLDALDDYIDIEDTKHLFIENRSQIGYLTYPVEDVTLGAPEVHKPLPFGDEAAFREIWTRFTHFFPAREIADVDAFRLFSDGEGNTLAYVDVKPSGTTLAMDIRDNQTKPDEYRTLLHEFAHVWSLPPEDFKDDSTDVASLKEDTFMNAYTERFWSQYGEEWVENKYKSDPEREAFYNSHITHFHEPYQATNPKEDFAVTFVKFVTEPMPEGQQLKDVKIRTLYEYPELVALRTTILENMVDHEKINE